MPYSNQISRSDMGGMIPVEYSRDIIGKVAEASVVMRLGRRLRDMPTQTRTLPVLSALPTAYFLSGDTGLKQTTEVNWEGITITAEELAAIVPIPEAALDDNQFPIWDEVRPLLIEALGLAIDQAVILGTNKPASWPAALLTGAVAAGNAVTIGTVGADLYDDLLSEGGVISKLEEDGYMASGHVAAVTMRSKLRGVRSSVTGLPIFTRSPQDSTRYELDGEPILFPMNGAIDPASLLLLSGAWQYLVYAMRQDITFKIFDQGVIQDAGGSIQLNLMQQDMVALRVVMRLGFQLPNPVNRLNTDSGTRYPFAVLLPAS